jgi:hypothetical protein
LTKIKNITFLKTFLFDNSLPPIFKKVSTNNEVIFETKMNSDLNLKNQVLKVKDVPDYLDFKTIKHSNKTVINKVKTLKGHLVKLDTFNNISDYLKHNFGSKSRSNLRRYQNRLENCFNIKYVSYFGAIEKKKYNTLFIALRSLLIRRFNEKQETNYELQHLDEFHDIVYDLILNKKASLFVIYDDEKPISIRINMFKNNLSYYIISGYDIDYSKFHLGSIDMLKNIEWCINNNFKVYDLLKGYDYYKTKWATKSHYYYTYIAYNNSSLSGKYTYVKEAVKYKFYEVFKKYNIISKYKNIKKSIFGIKNNFREKKISASILDFDKKITSKLIVVDIKKNSNYAFLKKPIYDFLFLNNVPLNNITISKLVENSNKFKIKAKNKCHLLIIDN